LFSPQAVPAQFRGLPAAPFLVPAVLDALRKSTYASITEVVPGEAEAFCARRVRESGGIALTSDSDMLVYGLDPGGAVAFFNQLGCRSLVACEVLETPLYRTDEIAKRLGLEGLQRLAFEVEQDHCLTIHSAIRLAQQPSGNPAALADFQSEYDSLTTANPSATLSNSLAASSSVLDPRLSELVLSASSLPAPDMLPCYLPFLIDDPSRSSAWTPSLWIWQLLYSILPFAFPLNRDNCIVHEYTRKGHRVASSEISLLSESNISDQAKQLSNAIRERPVANSVSILWTHWWLFALSVIATWNTDSGKTPPPPSTMMRVCKGADSGKVLLWEDVHLTAQIQGVLYSLRMLKQLLLYLSAEKVAVLPTALLELKGVVEQLPDLDGLMPSRLERGRGLVRVDVEGMLGDGMRLGGSGVGGSDGGGVRGERREEDGFEVVHYREKRRKKGKAKERLDVSNQVKKAVAGLGNLYGFLPVE
jgi:hypothetical protein